MIIYLEGVSAEECHQSLLVANHLGTNDLEELSRYSWRPVEYREGVFMARRSQPRADTIKELERYDRENQKSRDELTDMLRDDIDRLGLDLGDAIDTLLVAGDFFTHCNDADWARRLIERLEPY